MMTVTVGYQHLFNGVTETRFKSCVVLCRNVNIKTHSCYRSAAISGVFFLSEEEVEAWLRSSESWIQEETVRFYLKLIVKRSKRFGVTRQFFFQQLLVQTRFETFDSPRSRTQGSVGVSDRTSNQESRVQLKSSGTRNSTLKPTAAYTM